MPNCSVQRPPTEMGQFTMEMYCPEDFKTYKIISVDSLRAAQFKIETDQFYSDL